MSNLRLAQADQHRTNPLREVSSKSAINTESKKPSKTARKKARAPGPSSELVKVTLTIHPDDVELLEDVRRARRKETGAKKSEINMSALVREAIRKCYGSAP